MNILKNRQRRSRLERYLLLLYALSLYRYKRKSSIFASEDLERYLR